MVRTAMYSVADSYEHYNKSIRSNIKGGGRRECLTSRVNINFSNRASLHCSNEFEDKSETVSFYDFIQIPFVAFSYPL